MGAIASANIDYTEGAGLAEQNLRSLCKIKVLRSAKLDGLTLLLVFLPQVFEALFDILEFCVGMLDGDRRRGNERLFGGNTFDPAVLGKLFVSREAQAHQQGHPGYLLSRFQLAFGFPLGGFWLFRLGLLGGGCFAATFKFVE